MAITFSCPNGHRLTCPDAQAGKPGKCPKCGAAVRVPSAVTPAPGPAAFTADEADETRLQEFGEDQSDDVADGEIVFLCPNGHRLHGPSEMVGRPGQCPHCKVRFLIPSPEDESEDEEAEPDAALGEFVIQIDTSPKEGSASSKSGLKPPSSTPAAPSAPSVAASTSASAHPFAALLARLWAYKEQGASLEIHLGDGKVMIPDRYAAPAAHPNYGVFSVREANGSHTLTAVAWDAIHRVAVRQLQQLPKELFG
ncbi:MAG TPA: hypothetical protein VMV10_19850 [Pirellulales bacterium]|nr:hypothetical protein [Pirellulales bacterium]